MQAAYVDTSVLVAEAFGERGGAPRHRLEDFDALFASRFLEAEFLSAFRREELDPATELLDAISWVDTGRSLAPELSAVFDRGNVRGADAWHLATALSLATDPAELTFLTFDARQRDLARKLGFRV